MKLNGNNMRNLIVIFGIAIFVMACSLSSNLDVTPTSTPTPIIPSGGNVVAPPKLNICEGLNGELEMQVLVGPSEAVGLEPFAVGNIPFSVVPSDGVYNIQGGGSIEYQEVLEKEWGTYTVEFDLEAIVGGDCDGDEHNGTLKMKIEISGDQMVEVRAEGFQGDYPWSGSHVFELSFPIKEGASAQGEGWEFVLHLN